MSQSLQVFMDSRSRKTVIITSIVLLLAGIAGIALPQFMSMAVAFFAGWLMLVVAQGFQMSHRRGSIFPQNIPGAKIQFLAGIVERPFHIGIALVRVLQNTSDEVRDNRFSCFQNHNFRVCRQQRKLTGAGQHHKNCKQINTLYWGYTHTIFLPLVAVLTGIITLHEYNSVTRIQSGIDLP